MISIIKNNQNINKFKDIFRNIINYFISNTDIEYVFNILFYSFNIDIYLMLNDEKFKNYRYLNNLSINDIKYLISEFIEYYTNFHIDIINNLKINDDFSTVIYDNSKEYTITEKYNIIYRKFRELILMMYNAYTSDKNLYIEIFKKYETLLNGEVKFTIYDYFKFHYPNKQLDIIYLDKIPDDDIFYKALLKKYNITEADTDTETDTETDTDTDTETDTETDSDSDSLALDTDTDEYETDSDDDYDDYRSMPTVLFKIKKLAFYIIDNHKFIDLSDNKKKYTSSKLIRNAFKLSKNIQSLDVSNNYTANFKDLELLFNKNLQLRKINFSKNNINKFDELNLLLKNNKQINYINLSNNKLNNISDFTTFLLNHKSINYLDLSFNNIRNIAPLIDFLKSKKCRIKYLNLSNNKIAHLINLDLNTSLEELDLSNNLILDEDIIYISKLIRNNKHIKNINLSYNNINYVDNLIKPILNSRSLQEINLSYNNIPNILPVINVINVHKKSYINVIYDSNKKIFLSYNDINTYNEIEDDLQLNPFKYHDKKYNIYENNNSSDSDLSDIDKEFDKEFDEIADSYKINDDSEDDD